MSSPNVKNYEIVPVKQDVSFFDRLIEIPGYQPVQGDINPDMAGDFSQGKILVDAVISGGVGISFAPLLFLTPIDYENEDGFIWVFFEELEEPIALSLEDEFQEWFLNTARNEHVEINEKNDVDYYNEHTKEDIKRFYNYKEKLYYDSNG